MEIGSYISFYGGRVAVGVSIARILCVNTFPFLEAGNKVLASCPWVPVTANGVDLLTKIYCLVPARWGLQQTHTCGVTLFS